MYAHARHGLWETSEPCRAGEGLMLLFVRDEDGRVESAQASFQGTSFTLGRAD